MSRSTHYVHDLRMLKAGSDYRYRIILTPPDAAANAPTGGTAPAWEATTGTSGYEIIPSGVVQAIAVGESQYESGYPLGLQTTPTLEVTFDLAELSGDLETYVLEAPYSGGISYAVPNSSYTLTAATTMTITLLCDRGDSTLAVEDFPVVYYGAVLRTTPRATDYNSDNGTAFRKVTFAHIARAVLELIPPEAITQNALYNGNTLTNAYVYDDGLDHKNSKLYEALWRVGPSNYAVTLGTTVSPFAVRLFSLFSLFTLLGELTQGVMRQYLRNSSVEFSFRTFTDNILSFGTPYDFFVFYGRSYDEANTRSAAITGGLTHQTENIYFPGIIFGGGYTFDVDTTELGAQYDTDKTIENPALVGGFYHPSDPDGIFAYSHAYDLLVDMVGGAACKGAYHIDSSDPNSIYCVFAPIGETTGFNVDEDLPVTKIIGREGTISEGVEAGQVRAVRVALPSTVGDDMTEIEAVGSGGVLGEQELLITGFFTNHPTVGEFDRFILDYWNDDMTAGYLIYGVPRYCARKLYYYAEPTDVGNPIPILVHEQVGLITGWGTTTPVGTVTDYPDFINSGEGDDNWDDTNRIAYRAVALVHQAEAGLAYAIASNLVSIFTGYKMWKTALTVDRDRGWFEHMGARMELQNNAGTLAGLPALDDRTLSGFGSWPHYGYVVAIAWEEDGTSTLTLLGVPS